MAALLGGAVRPVLRLVLILALWAATAVAAPLASDGRSPEDDRALLDCLQRMTFSYARDCVFEESGLVRERSDWGDIATVGGTGFGVCALVVGVERGWMDRSEAVGRLNRLTGFLLDRTDRVRLHGAFPHWMDGRSGATVPFGSDDDGADLVETAFLMQGLLTARAYFDRDDGAEAVLRERVTRLWTDVDWRWFADGSGGLFWHWSPVRGFAKGMRIRGNNEALVAYVLALSSPSRPIGPEVLAGWYEGPDYASREAFGYRLSNGMEHSGPLFTVHFSFIGLDPRALADAWTPEGYLRRNTVQALMNRAYCLYVAPEGHGYHEGFWGLTSSETAQGYRYASPWYECATVAPTAALSSMPYVPEYAMRVLWDLHERHPEMWGPYGPYDAFSLRDRWHAGMTSAIDQLPICCMVENHRSGLLWRLFMSVPEIGRGLAAGGFAPPALADGFRVVPAWTGLPEKGAGRVYDMRRHPDDGRYRCAFSTRSAGTVRFAVSDGDSRLAEWSMAVQAGVHEAELPVEMLPDGRMLTLEMTIGERRFVLPIRLH